MCDLIYLIGYRGVGKSTIGKHLATLLDYDFIDTDQLICERKHASIDDIVAQEGWQEFRQCEKEVLRGTSELRRSVIATGGGAILHHREWKSLRLLGLVVWLTADQDVIGQRMRDDVENVNQRPSLTGDTIVAEVKKVLQQRIPLYRRTAHQQLDTGRLTIQETLDNILELLKGMS